MAKTKAQREAKTADEIRAERTPEEWALIERFSKKPRIKATPRFTPKQVDGVEKLDFEGDKILEIAKLARDFGVYDWEAAQYLAEQLAHASGNLVRGRTAEKATNTAIALMNGIAPRDAVEGMLAMQMIATHTAAMEHLRKLSIEQNHIQIYDSISNRANKLMRTFSAQVEALNRHRNAGKQTITVNHIGQQVNANEAIAFGGAPGEAGGVIKNAERPLVSQGNQQLNYQPEDDMRSQGEAQRQTVPEAADGERQVLSPRRREPRRVTRSSELELQARPIHEGSNG